MRAHLFVNKNKKEGVTLGRHLCFSGKLFYPCELINSSSIQCLAHFVNLSFLQYLATTHQNVSNFSPFLLIWHH